MKRHHYLLVRLHEIFTARITAEPLFELKTAFSLHAYLCAEHASAFRKRVSELREPPLGLDAIPHDGLKLACDEILLVDDRSSSVSLPEVPLLGVLPGTGGLTRVTDKRHVRHDLADIFCTTNEGVRGQKAKDWRLVDDIAKPAVFAQKVRERAEQLAAGGVSPSVQGAHDVPAHAQFGVLEVAFALEHHSLAVAAHIGEAFDALLVVDKNATFPLGGEREVIALLGNHQFMAKVRRPGFE